MRRSALLAPAAALLMGLAPGCARQGAPTGGPQDRVPPVVVATRPDTFADTEVVDDPIRIEFSERISERPTGGTLDDAVIVSPRTGEVQVDHKRDALEVGLSGGVRAGLVYTVTVLPVVRDMFDNALQQPFEFVFSTGGAFVPTALAGLVLDRLTGLPVEGARVTARPVAGDTSLLYVSRTDTSGIYTLRYVPPGEYVLTAFTDRDRDFVADSFEVQGRARVALADTVLTDLVILEPDTSRARLARAVPVDSAVVELTFDDHLDPEQPPSEVTVAIAPDSTTPADAAPPPEVVRVFHPAAWREWRDSVEAAAAPPDTADTLEAPAPDTATAPPEPPAEVGAGQGEGGSLLDGPLPEQELVAVLGRSLPPGVPYRITVSGVRNVAGLGEGGGTVLVLREEPVRDTTPAADTAATDTTGTPEAPRPPGADTTGAPPDTTGAPPDTTGAPPDTTGAPPDTTVAPPDTTVAPPDTTGAPPDTAGAPPDTTAPARPAASLAPPGRRPPPRPVPGHPLRPGRPSGPGGDA